MQVAALCSTLFPGRLLKSQLVGLGGQNTNQRAVFLGTAIDVP
jgi:hypothetical protein